jgi:hypothetical protein
MSCDNFGDMMTSGIGTTKLIGALIVLVGALVGTACSDSGSAITSTASIDPFYAELACAKLHLWGEWQEQESDFDVVRGISVEAIDAARRGDTVLYVSLVNYFSSMSSDFGQDYEWASPDDEAIIASSRRCRQMGIEVLDGWDGTGS